MKVTANWRFHKKKYNKLTRKPQAIRQSKAKLKALIVHIECKDDTLPDCEILLKLFSIFILSLMPYLLLQ